MAILCSKGVADVNFVLGMVAGVCFLREFPGDEAALLVSSNVLLYTLGTEEARSASCDKNSF